MTTQIQDVPENAAIFQHQSVIDTTVEAMYAFHEQPSALGKLTPPPIFMQLHEDTRTSLREGELRFTLWFGPIPVKWHVRHEQGPTETSFADRQLSGPMAYWRHEHIFEQVEGGTRLTDRITYAHKAGFTGLLTRLIFGAIPLKILFLYRHLRTRLALSGKNNS